MPITAGGVGSGLDVEGIVSQLMYLERQPVRNLESSTKELESTLSAFGKIKSALSTFETAMSELASLDDFKQFASKSSDEEVLTATASSSAAEGIYNISVSRLAQNHKMAADEVNSTDVFSGSISITSGAGSFSIDLSTIKSDGSAVTVSQLRDAINSSADNDGVMATIINTGDGLQRLMLTSEESGADNAITTVDTSLLSNDTSGPASGALTFSTINSDGAGGTLAIADLDAEFSIDGLPAMTSASNSLSSVIDGIDIELQGIGSSVLNLETDKEGIKESVQSFVDAYNALWKTLGDLEKGDLSGDSSVRSLKSAIRNVFNQPASGLTGSFTSLINVGINSDAKTGSLSLDSAALDNAVNLDLDSLAELFADSTEGFAYRLENIADTLGDSDGFIPSREESLRSQIRYNEDQVLSWESRLDLKEKAMRAKFAQLDALIGSMSSTSAFLANNLS